MIEGFEKLAPDPSLPILKSPKAKKESDWEYKGRSWNYFSHLLADAYGWTLEYIAELDVNEALGHIQEVLTSEHLEHEFYHSLSEVAFAYNKSTKKSDYKPLTRPYWMLPVAKPLRKFRIPKSLLPLGVGVDMSGLPEEYGIKKIIEHGMEKETTESAGDAPLIPPSS